MIYRQSRNLIVVCSLLCVFITSSVPSNASAAPDHAAAPRIFRVLFIGNSYTYFNNLPDLVSGLAVGNRAGWRIDTTVAAHGGATLNWHLKNGHALSILRAENWDYVVLQGHSLLGGKVKDGKAVVANPNVFRRSVRQWVTYIRQVNAKPVLFMTWARKEPSREYKSAQQVLNRPGYTGDSFV